MWSVLRMKIANQFLGGRGNSGHAFCSGAYVHLLGSLLEPHWSVSCQLFGLIWSFTKIQPSSLVRMSNTDTTEVNARPVAWFFLQMLSVFGLGELVLFLTAEISVRFISAVQRWSERRNFNPRSQRPHILILVLLWEEPCVFEGTRSGPGWYS